jgi:transcription antitermination factor NusG
MKHWFVFYTKSRHEKKVQGFLIKRGYNVFLPMQKVMRQWSDRKKKVEVPLFNSYLFVLLTEDEIPLVLQTPGISWNIRYNDRPAILRNDDLEVIQRFLSSGLFIEAAIEQALIQGDTVEVIDGPLKGMKGSVNRTSDGEKFSVLLESIHQNIIVTLDSMVLRKISG